MTKKILLLIAVTLLILSYAAAQDINAMTPEELQAYIQQLQAEQQPEPIVQQVIVSQVDEELRQDIKLLVNELRDLKEANKRMEERFGKLVTDTDQKIQESELRTIDGVTKNVLGMFKVQEENFKEFVHAYTNPVRMNLPIVGVFLMMTGVFLLWAGKQYKLTEGGRKK